MRQFLFVLGFLVAAPAVAQGVATPEITATLDDTALHLPVPAGYCAIDRGRPDEAALFEVQADALQPLNALLGIAIDCGELDAYRADKHQFGRYLEFMATQHDGQPIRRPDAERPAYLTELAGQLPRLDSKIVADMANQQTQRMGVSTSIQRIGLVGQDEAAVYLGGVATYNEAVVANVSALSLAGGRAVSCSFYRGNVDDGTVTTLLGEAKGEARAIIAANASADAVPVPGDSPAAPARFASGWFVTLAASVALLIAVAISALRRRR